MPLPIVSTPTYEMTIPSTQETVTYRPFLVKEEKVLLMAAESKNSKQIVNAMRKVFGACIESKGFDITKLPMFDLQYILLHLRSKSVGELAEANLTCPECSTPTPFSVDLSKVEVTTPEDHNCKIQLTDDIGIIMRYPTYEMTEVITKLDEESIDGIITMLAYCIDKIYDAENTYDRKDYSDKDIETFVEQLTQGQFQKIQKFFDTMPSIEHEVDFKCVKCKHEQKMVLRSMEDFFS